MKTCETCERRGGPVNKRHLKRGRGGCQVFTSQPRPPGKCWAWTDQKDWADVVAAQVEVYQLTKI